MSSQRKAPIDAEVPCQATSLRISRKSMGVAMEERLGKRHVDADVGHISGSHRHSDKQSSHGAP